MNIGKAIKIILAKKNITQLELAEKTKLSKTTISLILNGKTMPQKETMQAIANALGLTPEILLLMSIEKEDVPEEKRQFYDAMWPNVENTLHLLFTKP